MTTGLFSIGKEQLLNRCQINRCIFTATINLNFKFEPIPFIQVGHASPFNRRNMDECIGLAVITLNKAEALHRVEKFDCSSRFFTRELTLRAATITAAKATACAAIRAIPAITRWAAVGYWHGFAVDLKISRRNLATTINQRETKWLAVSKPGQTGLFNRRDVNEHIFATIIADNKAKAFLPVEEFYNASALTNDLGRHRWPTRGTAATKTTAAASTATKAIATAKTAATAAESITTAAKTAAAAAILIVTKTVPLVSAAPAAITTAPFIETHAKNNFPQNSSESSSLTPYTERKAQSCSIKSQ
jgi:hypothetical protein